MNPNTPAWQTSLAAVPPKSERRREYPMSYFTPETQAGIRKAQMEMTIARLLGADWPDEEQ